ncbi:choline ethanolamine kinase [Blastocystis sp. subtype 4]|uniref:choline ethanolamine kinase n=1 Tax=Blastocystis sp. subtype 4 TaxID=944170 RepID=UPI000711D916|nr:choline ethanolamine kinase [Blastocystis sp. subtype 4]KNB45764.1 choline ethanolamine kinase [Blastocystis sp. subtype 4]|eukprot:XP_014529207.1 choline ethanolamine kinase [Blastocystis sp. subtype 4]
MGSNLSEALYILDINHPDLFKDLNICNLLEEIHRNEELIRNESTDIVYGHQDLLRGNVLKNAKGEVLIIDFEYTCLLPAPLDICHHYCEWMTRYDSPSYWIDFSLHPTDEEEKNFIHAYLLERCRNGKDPSESNVNEMQQLVHRFQCFSFFFWFVWAVMQTELGTDWDSKGYAMSRWHLYKELKKQYYGVEALPIVSE